MKFEEKISELEQIVSKLEDGTLSLAESISLFEKGISFPRTVRKFLMMPRKKYQFLWKMVTEI